MPRSRTSVPLPVLPLPPLNERNAYLNQLVRTITQALQTLDNPGELRGTELVLTHIPTSGVGLPVGSVYTDDTGHLFIVRANIALLSGASVTASMGTVTVVIS